MPGEIGGLFHAADDAAISQIADLKTLLRKLPNPSHLASSVSGIVEADVISLTGSSNGFATTLTAFVNALESALCTILTAVGLSGKIETLLDDVVMLIGKVGDVVLAPLSVMEKYLDLSPTGELITKINTAAAHMSAQMAPDADVIRVPDSAAKDIKIGALVVKAITTVVNWIKAAVPITVNLNGDAGGALGVLASLGASVHSLSLTNIVLQPVSGACDLGASTLTTFAGFKD
ncbi:hypothetical protein [uncultured Tateyamaria sp.]|uniref:hypothetical protein n=1 Tax=Tateyamaria sp. 1078 TaxID=3417464 RepID=UPI00261A08BE|nr:hypothetical protein [uncultured Tateyamaria sp.]